jgi:hypothetical protein
MRLLNLLLTSVVNGVTAETELNTRRAADGRHPPFITSFALPAAHAAWPEGTIMVAGASAGSADADAAGDGAGVIGVLETRVEANEQSGNVMLHGSCPADILKWVDSGVLTDANGDQIEALRGIGIYV